jgi:alkyl hydroperoxide reductase subunit F
MQYELIIIGAGPAACAAAVYAARKRIQTLLIAEEVGGQSSVSDTIFNWIGTPEIGGGELAANLKKHIEYYTTPEHTLTLKLGTRVANVTKNAEMFTVATANESFETKSVLIATGSAHRKLDVPGAQVFDNKGIMYCATCDGPLFAGQPVAVAGGGNAALEAVLQLSQYASHVTLLHRSDAYRADQITVDNVSKLPNVTLKKNVEIVEIKGDAFVNAIVYKEKDLSAQADATESIELPISAIFVEIGQIPNTSFVQSVVPLTADGKVIVDPMNQRTQTLGIWAAGDCTNGLYHQNNIAAGDAVKAIEDLYIWLKTGK